MNGMTRIEVAIHQMDRAIRLFLEEKDYISSITLAGASEEILGKYCKSQGKKVASETFVVGLKKRYNLSISEKIIRDKHLNIARNCLKHFGEDELGFKWEGQAVVMLIRLCKNYTEAFSKVSDSMLCFYRWLSENQLRLREEHYIV